MDTQQSRKIDPRTHIGCVALVVSDLARSLEFYTTRIGLRVLAQDAAGATLGVAGRALLALRAQPGAKPVGRGRTGLYHFALLLPSRADLGVTVQHLLETRTPVSGASDHGVSEAIYLDDPDGHGIEIYRDRPQAEWPLTPQGDLAMVNAPFDVPGVVAEGAGRPWEGMPPGTVMGHVHLHVNQIRASEAFYVDILGFDLMQRFGGQASFISAGGYHHHVGVNVWAGLGAPPPSAEAARLLWVEVALPDGDALTWATARARAAGLTLTAHVDGWLLRDPAQNGVVLRA